MSLPGIIASEHRQTKPRGPEELVFNHSFKAAQGEIERVSARPSLGCLLEEGAVLYKLDTLIFFLFGHMVHNSGARECSLCSSWIRRHAVCGSEFRRTRSWFNRGVMDGLFKVNP